MIWWHNRTYFGKQLQQLQIDIDNRKHQLDMIWTLIRSDIQFELFGDRPIKTCELTCLPVCIVYHQTDLFV